VSATASRLSAIVCVRNGAARIGRALASIRDQIRPPDEIVLVDGHSTDDTLAVALAVADVRVVVQPGAGLANARNAGIAAASGDLIAFLDHDDRWTPDKLAIQVPLLAGDEAPDAAIGHLRLVEDVDGTTPLASPRGDPRLGRTPGTLLARRAAFTTVGGFDPTLGMGCDMDWFIRAADQGLAIAVLPDVLLLKSVRADSLSADPRENRRAAMAVLARRHRR